MKTKIAVLSGSRRLFKTWLDCMDYTERENYHCVTRTADIRGCKFSSMIELRDAHRLRDYHDIKHVCKLRVVAVEPTISHKRWEALLSVQRIRHLGSAGIVDDNNPYGKPYGDFCHAGFEFWTTYDFTNIDKDRVIKDQEIGVDILTRFADKALAVKEKKE